ncbi:MAG: AMP-binding protein, partial [Acidobacteria bacterium]|nr:AMP-binding protein [Acidobacteriota bacterium]
QQGMLFHTLYEPEEGTYIGQLGSDFNAVLDLDAFQRAWEAVVRRHGTLRTGFQWQGVEEPLQHVRGFSEALRAEVRVEDLRQLSVEEQQQRVAAILEEDRHRGFDLERPPLVRFMALRLGEERLRLVWSFHQLILDGWSLPVLLQDFFTAYQQGVSGGSPALPPAPSYREYVAWLERQDLAAAETFWRRELAGFEEPTAVAFDRAAGTERRHREIARPLSRELTSELEAFARRQRLTLNTLVEGAWSLLLGRGAGAADVLFGVVVSGRPPELAGVDEMVGLLINTLPVRVRIPGGMSVESWLAGLQLHQAELRQYEYSPLADVQRWSGVELAQGQSLFDTFMVFQNYPEEDEGGAAKVLRSGDPGVPEEGELQLGTLEAEERSTYALTLVANPGPELELVLENDASRFDATTVERQLRQLENLLTGMATAPEAKLEDLSLLSPAEAHQLRVEWRSPAAAAEPETFSLHALVAAQAERTPDAPAVLCGGTLLPYAELQRRAGALARELSEAGVGPETVVGLSVEKGADLVVGLLGILQAGGAYLPLDPAYPAER